LHGRPSPSCGVVCNRCREIDEMPPKVHGKPPGNRGKPSENRGKLPTVKSCLETVEMRGKAPGKCAESRWKTAGDAGIPAAFAYPCPNAEGREANGKRKRVSFTEWDLVCHFPIRTVTHS